MLRTILIVCTAALAPSGPYAHPSAAPPKPAGAPAAPPAAETPTQLADSAAKGSLRNPYKDSDATLVAEGNRLFMNYACSGCHGGTGGGGMCPPVTNDIWIYGGDDDTLFRLVTYGSVVLQSKGYSRIAQENVVAPMPPMGGVVKTADDLWRILAFIRANFHGSPGCKFGCKPEG